MLFACFLLVAAVLLIIRDRRLSRKYGGCAGCPYAEECRKRQGK